MTRGHAAGGGGRRGPRRPRAASGAGGRGSLRSPGPGSGLVSKAPGAALDLASDVFFVRVRLEETGELFRVADCRSDMTVRELREELDLVVGVPFNLQRLHYLDQGDLMDNTTLRFNDIQPGALLSLRIWHYDGWTDVVMAAVEGDPSKLSCLGVTEDSLFRTVNSKHLEGDEWRQWTSQRAFVALYITTHRGHFDAVQYLLEHGASCQLRTPVGRTALHAAAATGRLDCIGALLEHGASVHDRDSRGETPVAVAHRLERTLSERHTFLLAGGKRPSELTVRRCLPRKAPGQGARRARDSPC